MNRKERRNVSKIAKKQLDVIELRKKRLGIDDQEVRVFKTYLWGYLFYIKKGWKIAPIKVIGFMALAFKYDGVSLSIIWKNERIVCFGFRIRQNMKQILKIGFFKIYIKKFSNQP